MEKVLLFTVNYHTTDDLLKLLKSLCNLQFCECLDIIVINNEATKDSAHKISEFVSGCILANNITIINTKENLGYFGAVNYAIKQQTIELTTYSKIIISNNDIVIKDIDFITKLKKYKYDVIAPTIISEITKQNQNPILQDAPSSLRKFISRIYMLNYSIARIMLWGQKIYRRKYPKQRLPDKTNEVKSCFSSHGAFMIFSKSYFQKGGYIDSNYFLYGEEYSVSAICLMYKLNIFLVPDLTVYHNEHKSTNSDTLNRKIYEYNKQAYLYLIKTYKVLDL